MNIPVIEVAKICHQANKAYCESQGDFSQKDWGECEQWQRDSAYKGVAFVMENPHLTLEDSHISWLKEKEETGWKYGEVKDAVAKTHPCFLPYNELPMEQRIKEVLFRNIVLSFFPPVSGTGRSEPNNAGDGVKAEPGPQHSKELVSDGEPIPAVQDNQGNGQDNIGREDQSEAPMDNKALTDKPEE